MDRVRWLRLLRVALSGPLRCCHRPVSGRCVPGPSRPGPPRCCVGLRCLTTRRSRSSGFPAPPASLAFRLDLGVFRCVANLAVTSGIGIPPMTLQSPSRTSSAFLPLAPDQQTLLTLRSGHPPVGFVAPSARPTRGIHFPVRRVPPVPPAALTVGRSRSSQLGSRSAGPPYLVAGFHARFGPPAPFLTTLADCSSSDPVECFIHSRPWGSCPCSPMLPPGRQARRPFFPGRVHEMRTEVRVS